MLKLKGKFNIYNRIETKDMWVIHHEIKIDHHYNNGKIFNKKFKENKFVKMIKTFIMAHMEQLNYIN